MKRFWLLPALLLLLPALLRAGLVAGTNCGFVTVAPTADPGGTPMSTSNGAGAYKFTAPAGAVRVVELGWWCDNATEEANFELGLYADAAGVPGSLLSGASRTNAKGTTAGWKKASGLNILITGGNPYWIGRQLDTTATVTNIDYAVDASAVRESKSGATTLPDPWDGTSAAARLLAVYAVYETSSGPSVPVVMHHLKRSH